MKILKIFEILKNRLGLEGSLNYHRHCLEGVTDCEFSILPGRTSPEITTIEKHVVSIGLEYDVVFIFRRPVDIYKTFIYLISQIGSIEDVSVSNFNIHSDQVYKNVFGKDMPTGNEDDLILFTIVVDQYLDFDMDKCDEICWLDC